MKLNFFANMIQAFLIQIKNNKFGIIHLPFRIKKTAELSYRFITMNLWLNV